MTGRHDRRFVPLVSAAFAEGQGRYTARSVQRRVVGCGYGDSSPSILCPPPPYVLFLPFSFNVESSQEHRE
jgi:hypothetical protein